jgi:integrase
MREARIRRDWISGELAAMRVPDVRFTGSAPLTLRAVSARWQAARVDVSDGTAQTYRVALARLLPRLGDEPVNRIDAQAVADLVAELHSAGLRKQTIRKTISVLAMVLDHGRIQPNPARDKLTVRLPREERRELRPPTTDHVEAVVHLLPARYRLPAAVLDATGMRIGELAALTWGDVDEPPQRWRVSAAVAKTGRARWVPVPDGFSRRSWHLSYARTASLSGRCSRASAAIASEPHSRVRAARPASRSSHRTTYGIAA